MSDPMAAAGNPGNKAAQIFLSVAITLGLLLGVARLSRPMVIEADTTPRDAAGKAPAGRHEAAPVPRRSS